MVVAHAGSIDAVRCFVKESAPTSTKHDKVMASTQCSDGCSPRDSVDMLRCVVQEFGVDVHHTHHSDVSTTLVEAAHAGSIDALRCLVELCADINQTRSDGSTALIVAARESQTAAKVCVSQAPMFCASIERRYHSFDYCSRLDRAPS